MVAEIGIDLARFATAPRLAAGAGVAPGNDDRAGTQCSGKTRKGTRPRRAILTQLAHAAVQTQHTSLFGGTGIRPSVQASFSVTNVSEGS
jgi:transposase